MKILPSVLNLKLLGTTMYGCPAHLLDHAILYSKVETE